MNTLCPVCNAFAAFAAACERCGHALDDSGRIYDYYGDYSPYRPIDDSKLSNGWPDLADHLCVHVGWCPACGREQLVAIQERSDI